ncbi:MAG: DNA polymerase IV [Acidobacteriota bacterium]
MTGSEAGRETAQAGRLRRIIHVDMDAFYASVEQRDRPELRGRPVAVGGSPASRGVVAAASYEARKYGVRSAMPMARALRLCPDLVVVRADFTKYRSVSREVFEIFRSVTPLVEPLSLDEAYLDVTENAWGELLAVRVARRIKQEIRERCGLTASAGVAPNKFLAKIASGWKKPDGLTVVAPDRVESFLHRLPVEALWGVGPVTARRLRERGITRLIDVRTADPAVLRDAIGGQTDWLLRLAHGQDDRPVLPNRPARSSSAERTFAADIHDPDRMREELAGLARENVDWLRKKGLLARTVTIKVRYPDFTTVTRSHTAAPTDEAGAIVARAVALLERTDAGRRGVRLLGAGVRGFMSRDALSEGGWLPFDDGPATG